MINNRTLKTEFCKDVCNELLVNYPERAVDYPLWAQALATQMIRIGWIKLDFEGESGVKP